MIAYSDSADGGGGGERGVGRGAEVQTSLAFSRATSASPLRAPLQHSTMWAAAKSEIE